MSNVIKLKVEKETAEKLFFVLNHAALQVLDHIRHLEEDSCSDCAKDSESVESHAEELNEYLKLMRNINAQTHVMPGFLWSGNGFIRDIEHG